MKIDYNDLSLEQVLNITDKYNLYNEELKKYNIDLSKYKDSLIGGKADNLNINDILEFDLNQIIKGIQIESEHSQDPYIRLTITLDHLVEFSDYYTRLTKMEEEAKSELKNK